jgi:hypothetical protein
VTFFDYQPRSVGRYTSTWAFGTTVLKFVLALSLLAGAMRLVYGHAYETGYFDGMLVERARNRPPPTPLSELVKRYPPPAAE